MILFLKNLLFTIIIPGTAGVYVPILVAGNRPAAEGPLRVVAIALFVLGGSIYAWCVWDFATFGRGTPAPIDAPKKLVVRGLYRYGRNPMYVGVLTVILGWAVLYQSWPNALYFLGMAAMFHSFVVFYEEPTLRRLFGKEYEEYCGRVRRWLPRPPRPSP